MIVSHFSTVYNSKIVEKGLAFGYVLNGELTAFFSKKEYGNSVKEVFYRVTIVPPEMEATHLKSLHYVPRKKAIEVIIRGNYEKALVMTEDEYGKYLADLIVTSSTKLVDLELKDFDFDRYFSDLEKYFSSKHLY